MSLSIELACYHEILVTRSLLKMSVLQNILWIYYYFRDNDQNQYEELGQRNNEKEYDKCQIERI